MAAVRLSLMILLLALANPVLSLSLKEGEVGSIRFESCSGCRLNSLPEVRRFLREVVEPGLFGPLVTVKFVPGKSPTMLFFDYEDVEIESLLIQEFSFNDLTAMVQSLGFKRRPENDAEAKDEICRQSYALTGCRGNKIRSWLQALTKPQENCPPVLEISELFCSQPRDVASELSCSDMVFEKGGRIPPVHKVTWPNFLRLRETESQQRLCGGQLLVILWSAAAVAHEKEELGLLCHSIESHTHPGLSASASTLLKTIVMNLAHPTCATPVHSLGPGFLPRSGPLKRSAPDTSEEYQHGSSRVTPSLLLSRRHAAALELDNQGARSSQQLNDGNFMELPCGLHEDIGKRAYMEDRHLRVMLHLAAPSSQPHFAPGPAAWEALLDPLLMMAIFDGHGGSSIADFCCSNAAAFVARELCKNEEDVAAALRSAFVALDAAAILQDIPARPGPHLEMGGSTALVVLCSADKIICANCGDSRAVLARGGETVPLSDDHKPDREDELARIKQAGGRVVHRNGGPRVMGILAMSRAIGDTLLQQFGVTPVPEVLVVDRSTQDEFLILASDGLWGVVSSQEAVDITRRCLQRAASKGASPAASTRIAAQVLSRTAFSRGNSDNITVLILDLRNLTLSSESGYHGQPEAEGLPSSSLGLHTANQHHPGPTSPAAPITPPLIPSPASSMHLIE